MHWVLVVINAASVVAEGDIIAWNVEVWRGFGILQLLFSTPMCQAKLHHGKRSHRALCLCPALEFLALCFSFSTALPHFAVRKTKMACVRASDRFPVAPFADLVAWDPLDLKLFFFFLQRGRMELHVSGRWCLVYMRISYNDTVEGIATWIQCVSTETSGSLRESKWVVDWSVGTLQRSSRETNGASALRGTSTSD